MKRKLVILSLILGLVALPLVVACAQPAPAPEVKISVVGAVSGGGLQVSAEALAEALRGGIPNSSVTVPTSNPAAGLALIGTGRGDVAIGATTRMASAALRGDEPFDIDYDFKVIAVYASDVFMFITKPDIGLTTFKDIVDKQLKISMSVGPQGSNSLQIFEDVAEVYGITFEDIDNWGGKIHFAGSGDSVGLLGDGLIDAFGGSWGQPFSRIADLSASRDMLWVGLDEDAIPKLGAEFGYTRLVASPAPDYGWGYKFVNTEDVLTVEMSVVIAVPTDMSVDKAYIITKTIFEAKDYLVGVNEVFQNMTPEKTADLGKFMDLHEGANKYLREVGALK